MSLLEVSPDDNLAPPQPDTIFMLRLFIAGLTPNSRKAVENVKVICEKYLEGRYKLEVIDVYQQPELASGEQLIALPVLVKDSPGPMRRLIGDMSETEKVLIGLNLITT